jgi:chromosomal replication initiation ATPase DnaA
MAELPLNVDLLLARLRRKIKEIQDDDPQGANALRAFLRDELAYNHKGRSLNAALHKRKAVYSVVARVALETGIEPEEALGNRRSASVSRTRHLAMAVCSQRFGWSKLETAQAFGVDRSTVVYALRRIEKDPLLPQLVKLFGHDHHRATSCT